MDFLLLAAVSFISVLFGYWLCHTGRPKTVGNLLINDTEDVDGPFLLLELDSSVKDLSEHNKVIVKVVKQS